MPNKASRNCTGIMHGWGCTPQEQEMVKREIEATNHAIDRLVYGLYGLTKDEIRIVEGKQ